MRICLLTVTRIADDPRVRRQGDALSGTGHDVVGLGGAGARAASPVWRTVDVPVPRRTPRAKVSTAVRTQVARLHPALAEKVYWSFAEHRAMRAEAIRQRADVYHANDWRVLPVAAAAAAATGARYVYDSHEFAVEENAASRVWRLVFPHYVRAIEERHIDGAAFVSTVGDGIADLLHQTYGLPTRPLVIRNVPAYQPMPYREPGDRMVVLYHGMFNADRGLDALVASVARWNETFDLVLRGSGPPAVEAQLRRTAEAAGVTDRVTFEPPVPMTELVAAANRADIGIHPIPASNHQTRYALPNKLFEYLMAGLAVVVTDAPEMGRIVREHGCGTLIADPSPATIADAVNQLRREEVERFKHAALEAAATLNWEHEQTRLLSAYDALR